MPLSTPIPSTQSPGTKHLGGGDKQPVELLADEDWTTPEASPRADGRSDRFWADSVAKVISADDKNAVAN
jgi:hypothetical protein